MTIISKANDMVRSCWIIFFESPLGILGKCVDRFVLAGYLRTFLIERNCIIKELAEGS